MKPLSSLLLFTVTVSLGRAATEADALKEIIVEANAAPRNPSLTLPTPSSSREQLSHIPGGVETIDAERFLTGRSSTMADTFFLSPGVVAQPRFGSDEARLSIRGSGLQRTFHGRGLRVLQDGIPINAADGSFDMQALEPTAASHINVLRGANALSLGSSTLGGAIDYLSRSGRNSPGGFLRLEAGSYGYLRATLAGGYTLGSADLYASFTEQAQQGFRRHADQHNQRLFSNFGWRFHEDLETRFYFNAVRTDSELPGSLTKDQLESHPRRAAAANLSGDQKRDFDLLRVANQTTLRHGNTLWKLSTGWTYKDLDHPIYQVLDYLSNDFFVGLTGTHETELASHANLLTGGVLFSYGETHTANFLNLSGSRGSKVSAADQTASNLEGFLENRFSLVPEVHLVTGLSGAISRRKSEPNSSLPGAEYANDFHELAPKIGFLWDASASVQVYGNLSGSYEAPSFSESTTAVGDNKAQTATTWELGTRGQSGPVRWDASLYHAKIEDELLTIDHDNDPSTAALTVNADQTTHTGIELGAEIDLLGTPWTEDSAEQRLVLRGAWTYGRFTFDDDEVYGDNKIAGLPPHLIRGELMWEHARGWYAGPTFEWVPVKSYIDHRNTFSADPYALLGFKIGRRLDSGLSWFLEARNLTDERYAATTGVIEDAQGTDQAQFLPGDGRSLFAGIEWKW